MIFGGLSKSMRATDQCLPALSWCNGSMIFLTPACCVTSNRNSGVAFEVRSRGLDIAQCRRSNHCSVDAMSVPDKNGRV